MSGKVILEVTKGTLLGQKFTYEEMQRVYIGRQEDCGIVMPENTVSRYHCVLEIIPPEVKLQDFGSLNGTFLNGEKIGQRERTQTMEEGQQIHHEEYPLKDGDVLRLGKQCELTRTLQKVRNHSRRGCGQHGKRRYVSRRGCGHLSFSQRRTYL